MSAEAMAAAINVPLVPLSPVAFGLDWDEDEPVESPARELDVCTHSIALRISREDAVGYGLVEPTPEEAAAAAARHEQYLEERRMALARLAVARKRLDDVSDPLARAVLDLHAADESPYHPGSLACGGCDFGGYEGEAPPWPCATVHLVARRFGVDLPAAYEV